MSLPRKAFAAPLAVAFGFLLASCWDFDQKVSNCKGQALCFQNAPAGLWLTEGNGALGVADVNANGGALTVPSAFAPTGGSVFALAFDPSGRLWAAGNQGTTAAVWALSLADGGALTPTVVVTPTVAGVTTFHGAAFASNGDLWLSSQAGVVRLTPNQLLASGSPAPASVAHVSDGQNPLYLAFDAHGNLWVSAAGTNSSLEELKLESGAVSLSSNLVATGPFTNRAIAFASDGKLWAMNYTGAKALRFSFDGGEGTMTGVAPELTLNIVDAGTAGDSPSGIAFDSSGDLWVFSPVGPGLFKFKFSDVAAPTGTATLTPDKTFSLTLDPAGGMQFNPPLPGVGLYP